MSLTDLLALLTFAVSGGVVLGYIIGRFVVSPLLQAHLDRVAENETIKRYGGYHSGGRYRL